MEPSEFDPTWYESSEVEHGELTSEIREAVKSHCLISGFSWTAGLAHYIGHWQDEDIKSPFGTEDES